MKICFLSKKDTYLKDKGSKGRHIPTDSFGKEQILCSDSKGTRGFIDILKSTQQYSVEIVAKLLKDLRGKNRYSYQDVLSLLRFQTQNRPKTELLSKEKLKSLGIDKQTTTYMSLSTYNELLRKVGCENER